MDHFLFLDIYKDPSVTKIRAQIYVIDFMSQLTIFSFDNETKRYVGLAKMKCPTSTVPQKMKWN